MLKTKIENFIKKELDCNCCGLLVENDQALIALQAFRYYLNNSFKKNVRISVSSGTRCEKHNSKIGGATKSRHLLGEAFDLSSPDISYTQLYEEAIHSIIRYDKSKFVHVDVRKRTNYEIKNWIWDK